MSGEFGESMSQPPRNSYSSNSGSSGDAGDFECNICFDLAQDPIVTLCGHLFCWPCLYKWLTFHSNSKGCPVCKAIVEEDKLVPIYGRGKNSKDPRIKTMQDANIPRRPMAQRPDTAPTRLPEVHLPHFPHQGFGFHGGLGGGFAPMASARFGNFTFSAAFGGLFPSLFSHNVHGFPTASIYGNVSGFPHAHGYSSNAFHRGHGHGYPWSPSTRQDTSLKMLLFFVLFCVVAAFIML
uniref:E3 ubiquitin-protein ligase RMA n=1 Tax=Kalanchoe fedtschenkoi TaxID=63787 RepID=A0A7N0VBR0_KALFE